MLVTATLPREAHNNAIVVPRSAVAQTENGYAVYVVGPDNKAQEVPVRVGVQTDTLSEVISPKVQPGTKVITTRPDTLKDGSTVAVNPTETLPPNGGSSTQMTLARRFIARSLSVALALGLCVPLTVAAQPSQAPHHRSDAGTDADDVGHADSVSGVWLTRAGRRAAKSSTPAFRSP